MNNMNENFQKEQKKSILRVIYVFVGLFILTIIYFTHFILVKSGDVINNAYNRRQGVLEEKVIRGNILSSKGEILARTAIDKEGNEKREYPYGDMFAHVATELATKMAEHVGVNLPQITPVEVTATSPVLSEANTIFSAATQKVGVLVGEGFEDKEVNEIIGALNQNGVFFDVISERLGPVTGTGGTMLEANQLFVTASPVLYDSLYVIGGQARDQTKFDQDIRHYVNMAYRHFKPIGLATTAERYGKGLKKAAGVVFAMDNLDFETEFMEAVKRQRFWERALEQKTAPEFVGVP